MSKKHKRLRNLTVHGCVEGEREDNFLTFLTEVYKSKENHVKITWEGAKGGAPDRFVNTAVKSSDRDKSFAWLDEDFEPHFPLNKEARECLAKCWNIKEENLESFFKCPLRDLQKIHNPTNRKPLLIVSQPICSESVILKTLGKILPYDSYDSSKRDAQIQGLKNKLNDLIGRDDEIAYYHKHLTVDVLESKRKEIPELDLLISLCCK